ncbi:MAG: hypothetical protein QXL47_04715 [Candidatus Anstonellales archaeon]
MNRSKPLNIRKTEVPFAPKRYLQNILEEEIRDGGSGENKKPKIIEMSIEKPLHAEAAVGKGLGDIVKQNGEIAITKIKQKIDAMVLYLNNNDEEKQKYAISELYKMAEILHDIDEVIFEIIDGLAYATTKNKAHDAFEALTMLLENREVQRYVKEYIIERVIYHRDRINPEETNSLKSILNRTEDITTNLNLRNKAREVMKELNG